MAVRIVAEVVIPGRGEPLERGTVIFDRAGIAWVGPTASAPPVGSDDEVTEVAAVLPGLWDCHTHFLGMPTPDLATAVTIDPVTAAARATADARAMVLGGVTSAREVGGLGLQLAVAIGEGRIAGPRIHAAGRILSTTGGHGDIHAHDLDVVASAGCAPRLSLLCDGVPEVTRAVRLNLRQNARLIKICASGGVMSEVDHPDHQQFSDSELAAIVAEAGRADRIVAAHCHGRAGILAALRAGCHTIEHGSRLDEEAAEAMVASGAMLVPTRFVVESLLEREDTMPAYAYRKLFDLATDHQAALKLAIASGVRIAAGCDLFVSGRDYGESSREIRHLIDAGMTDLQAIEAATANGPDTLGPQAPRSGQLRPGYDADAVAFDANPLEDRSIWGDPSRVVAVWSGGRPVT